jgi:hypothetical protein
MAGTVIADRLEAGVGSQLVIDNGVALTPPTITDVNGAEIGTFCRAWVNFNGTGTIAIRSSFNVSSVGDNGTGNYSINFSNAMPDINYACLGTVNSMTGVNGASINSTRQNATTVANTVSSQRVFVCTDAGNVADSEYTNVAIFR